MTIRALQSSIRLVASVSTPLAAVSHRRKRLLSQRSASVSRFILSLKYLSQKHRNSDVDSSDEDDKDDASDDVIALIPLAVVRHHVTEFKVSVGVSCG